MNRAASSTSSLMAALRGFGASEGPPPGPGGPPPGIGGPHLPPHGHHSQQQQSSAQLSNHSVSTAGRAKQPPPGFDPLSMMNTGTNGQQSTGRNMLSPDMGILNLEALTSQLNMNAGFGGHHNDLDHPHHHPGGRGGSRHDSGGLGNGFGPASGHHSGSGLLSNHHLHNGMQQPPMGLGLKENQQSIHHTSRPGNSFLLEKQQQQQQQSLSKNWEEGLRALLPNVNVSFGALPHVSAVNVNGTDSVSAGSGGHRMYSQQQSMMNNDHHGGQPHHPHERMQRHQQQSMMTNGAHPRPLNNPHERMQRHQHQSRS